MRIKEIVHIINSSADEDVVLLLKNGTLSEERLLECTEKFRAKVKRIIAKYKTSESIYDGQLWVAKEDCWNNFRKGQVVPISHVDLEEGTVVIDGVMKTTIANLKDKFVPKNGR